MKNIIIYLLLFLAIGSTWLLSCHKDPGAPTKIDPCPWPDITTEGKHTLGFKINGKEWVPCVDFFAAAASLRPINASLTESDGSIGLTVTGHYFRWADGDSTDNVYGIWFSPLRLGIVTPNELVGCKFNFDQSNKGVLEDKWSLPESREGFHLEILKLDTVKNIISGTFEAILLPKYGADTLYITDGRFDLTYYQQ